AAQSCDGAGEAVVAGASRILVLDRERAVVAHVAQGGGEVAPELDRMPVADRAEDPRALVRVAPGLEDAVVREPIPAEAGVLGVYVEDRFAKLARGDDR